MTGFIWSEMFERVKEHPRTVYASTQGFPLENCTVALITVISFCSINIVAIKQLYNCPSAVHHCPS